MHKYIWRFGRQRAALRPSNVMWQIWGTELWVQFTCSLLSLFYQLCKNVLAYNQQKHTPTVSDLVPMYTHYTCHLIFMNVLVVICMIESSGILCKCCFFILCFSELSQLQPLPRRLRKDVFTVFKLGVRSRGCNLMLQFEDLWDLSPHLTISDGRRKDSDTIYDKMQLKLFCKK